MHCNLKKLKINDRLKVNITYVLLVSLGLANILSVFRYPILNKIQRLSYFYQIPLVEFSNTTVVITGIFFLSIAGGVKRKNRDAWKTAVYLTIISGISHLVKGFNFEELVLTFIVLLLLLNSEKEYKNSSEDHNVLSNLKILAGDLLLFLSYSFMGFFLLKRHLGKLTFFNLLRNLIFDVFNLSYKLDITPKGRVSLFLRSLPIIFIIIFAKFLLKLFENYSKKGTNAGAIDTMDVLRRYGKDTLSYFSTSFKKKIFLSEDIDGFISYDISKNIAVASSDPVCTPADAFSLAQKYNTFWHDRGISTAFMSISGEYLEIYKKLDYKIIKLGEEAIVNVENFDLEKDYHGRSGWKFKRAIRTVSNDDIEFNTAKISELDAATYAQMVSLNESWIKEFGGGKERGFTMTLSRIPNNLDPDCLFAFATKKAQGKSEVLGYMVFVPIYKGEGYSLDEMRRIKHAPNGLNEFLIVKTIYHLKSIGLKYLSLNFAPLSDTNGESTGFLKQIEKIITKRADRVLYINSLFNFNNKFHPIWKSRYLAFEKVTDLPQLIAALLSLEASVELDLNLPKKFLDALKPWN